MKVSPTLFFLIFMLFGSGYSQDPELTEVWEPVPYYVEPGRNTTAPPSDADYLFDGSTLDEWMLQDGTEADWIIENGSMRVNAESGDIKSRREFRDLHLYVEWRAPEVINGEGQSRGNSGIFLQDRYEVQVLDNWENPTYVNGMAGSIYKQHIPLSNPARRPGEWQAFEIFYRAPVFDGDEKLTEPARITVLLNGVLVQNNVEIYGSTVYRGEPAYVYHGADGIRLQNHGGDQVSFRNIWVREPDESVSRTNGITGQDNRN